MNPNPVGTANLQLVEDEIKSIIDLWKSNNPIPGWWSKLKGAWVNAVAFLLRVTDYLITVVESKIPVGADKKATVLAAMSKIYDALVEPMLPLVLKPFSSKIKDFVINVLISLLIDFIVAKYRDGSWNKQPPNLATLL